jgi:hypothetical protein
MSRQALGNVLAGGLFLIVAIYDFTQDDSGIGVVFLVFAAVFLGLGLSVKLALAEPVLTPYFGPPYASGPVASALPVEWRLASGAMTLALSVKTAT